MESNEFNTVTEFRKEYDRMRIDILKDAATIISIFENNGYEAYVVGGCVRDSILDRKPEDWDITTSAKPEEIKELSKTNKVFAS